MLVIFSVKVSHTLILWSHLTWKASGRFLRWKYWWWSQDSHFDWSRNPWVWQRRCYQNDSFQHVKTRELFLHNYYKSNTFKFSQIIWQNWHNHGSYIGGLTFCIHSQRLCCSGFLKLKSDRYFWKHNVK